MSCSLLGSPQVNEYVENGFVIISGLLDGEFVARLSAASDDFALGRIPTVATTNPSLGGGAVEEAESALRLMSEDQRLKSLLHVYYPEWVNETCQDLVLHPEIREAVSTLMHKQVGEEAREPGHILSEIFYKPPGELGRAWHQDTAYIETDSGSLMGVWLPIDNATIQNGCLWFVPGSHRSGHLYEMASHTRPEEFDHAQESRGFDDSNEVPVVVQAGDAVFFHGNLLHRSGANRSTVSRRAAIMHWLDVENPYSWKFPNDPVWPPVSSTSVWRFREGPTL